MSTKDIIALNIPAITADNCNLYLWVTNNFLPEGLAVMKAWGFEYKATITWAKDKIGLGQYFRGQTEHCLFGTKGHLPYKVVDGMRQQGRTLLTAPRPIHSRKPQEMRAMIEKVSYAPRIEIFARAVAPGWDAWGNQVDSDISLNFSQNSSFNGSDVEKEVFGT